MQESIGRNNFRNDDTARAPSSSTARSFSPELVTEAKMPAHEHVRPTFHVVGGTAVQRRVAVIDDDEGIRLYLQEVLTQQGFQVIEFSAAEQFIAELDAKSRQNQILADVVLCDVRLPGLDGLSFIPTLKSRASDVPVILMTAYAEVQSAVRAIREGAYDYLEKPFDTSRLSSMLENAIRFRRMSYENKFLKKMIEPSLREEKAAAGAPSGSIGAEELLKDIASDFPSLRTVERRYISTVLKRHNGKKEEAAKALGMSRRTLYRKLSDREEMDSLKN